MHVWFDPQQRAKPKYRLAFFGVETAVLAVPGTRGVHVEVVHEPPWNPSMMTDEARERSGIR